MAEIIVILPPEGCVRHLYAEDLAPIFDAFGPVTSVRRVSRVDTTADLADAALRQLVRAGTPAEEADWWADMQPVDGPVLGPFASRSAALAAEVEYLQERNLPVPKNE